MLSENGLMLYETSTNGDRRPSATHPLARITCASDDAPKSDSFDCNQTVDTAIVLVQDENEILASWDPQKFFVFGEGGDVSATSETARALESNKHVLDSGYRSRRVRMHLAVLILALVNITMTIVLVWIWNFKPENWPDKTYTYLCELRYEQPEKVALWSDSFKPELKYRPSLLFGSWVMLPYAIFTVMSIYLLVRTLVLYMASANYVRSLERNPQLSYDIWFHYDDAKRKSYPIAFNPSKGMKQMCSLMKQYDEISELVLFQQYKRLKTATRDTFYRAYVGFFMFTLVITVWAYFRMINDNERFVGLSNNPVGYRSNFRIGVIKNNTGIDSQMGAGFFANKGNAPECAPEPGKEWIDVPTIATAYDLTGIHFPSNLVNLWTCCAVHLLSAAIVSSWAYGHVVAMGPKSDLTRRSSVSIDHGSVQDRLDAEDEQEEVYRELRQRSDGRQSHEENMKVKNGVAWETIEKGDEIDMDTLDNVMFGGPIWKWSIPLGKGKHERLHWNACSTLCGQLMRTWGRTIVRRFMSALFQQLCGIFSKEKMKRTTKHDQNQGDEEKSPLNPPPYGDVVEGIPVDLETKQAT
jgi:hypothetical protein